ncbi:MAG: ATP-binding protein, partial [Myxococcota bacterium]
MKSLNSEFWNAAFSGNEARLSSGGTFSARLFDHEFRCIVSGEGERVPRDGVAKQLAHYLRWTLVHERPVQFLVRDWHEEPKQAHVFIRPGADGELLCELTGPEPLTTLSRLGVLSAAVDSMGDAVLVTEAEPVSSPGPRVLYSNRAFSMMTGYEPGEIFGKTPRILQGPLTSEADKARIRTGLEAWQSFVVPLKNYTKSGGVFDVELQISPVADETGWFTYWVSVQRDITQRNRQHRIELAAARVETVESLAAGLAHDLNNKLAVVVSALQSKLEDLAAHALAEQLIDARDITQQFINLSRAPQDRVEYCDAVDVVRSTVRHVNGHLGFQVVLREESSGERYTPLSASALEQVVLNLILNARDASENTDYARLEILSVEADSQLHLTFHDNGPGIPEEIRHRIMDPYFTPKTTGSGLGLSSTLAILRRAGGTLDVLDSERGALLEVTLPVATEPPAPSVT